MGLIEQQYKVAQIFISLSGVNRARDPHVLEIVLLMAVMGSIGLHCAPSSFPGFTNSESLPLPFSLQCHGYVL